MKIKKIHYLLLYYVAICETFSGSFVTKYYYILHYFIHSCIHDMID